MIILDNRAYLQGLQVLVFLIEQPQVLGAVSLKTDEEMTCTETNTHRAISERSTHLEWRLADQTLIDDGSYAPQVGLGIIVLGHDDLRSLTDGRNGP